MNGILKRNLCGTPHRQPRLFSCPLGSLFFYNVQLNTENENPFYPTSVSSDEHFFVSKVVAIVRNSDRISVKMPSGFCSEFFHLLGTVKYQILSGICLQILVKPLELDVVSLEISHISLAMIKIKCNYFVFNMPCGFTCFTLQSMLRINVLHRFILLIRFMCYKNRYWWSHAL